VLRRKRSRSRSRRQRSSSLIKRHEKSSQLLTHSPARRGHSGTIKEYTWLFFSFKQTQLTDARLATVVWTKITPPHLCLVTQVYPGAHISVLSLFLRSYQWRRFLVTFDLSKVTKRLIKKKTREAKLVLPQSSQYSTLKVIVDFYR